MSTKKTSMLPFIRLPAVLVAALCVLISTTAFVAVSANEQHYAKADEATHVTVRVGASLGLQSAPSDPYGFVQHHAYEGLVIWRDAFNNMSEALRTTRDHKVVTLELVVFENYGRFSYVNPADEIFMREQVMNMSLDESLDFILPPVGCPWGTVLRNMSLLTGHVPFTIGIADSREYWYRLSGSYGAPTSTLFVMRSAMPYLRMQGARTSYVIRMKETFQAEMCQGYIDNAPYHELTVTHTESVPFDYNTFGKPTSDSDKVMWDRITDDVIAKRDDVLVVCDYGEASQYIISLLKRKNYTPKAILLSYKYAEFKDTSLADFVLVPQSYHHDAGYPAQDNFFNSQQYDDVVYAQFGHRADYNNAQATLAGFLLSNAIMKAFNSSDKASVEQALRSEQLISFMGRTQFDQNRRQLMDNLVVQRRAGADAVIGPAVAARATIIYPMPKWGERSFLRKWGHWTEIVGTVLMSVGVVLSIGLCVFLFVYREYPVIVASSPLFCGLMLAGSIVIYVSNIFWMPNLASGVVCNLRAWLMPIGFMLQFGSLVAKTHRVSRLFNIRTLKVIAISNTQVLAVVLALIGFQCVLSLLMTFVGKIHSDVHVVDVWRPSLNYYECVSNHSLKYMYGVNLACAFLLLVYGSYLAVRVSDVPWQIYNESVVIHYATYTMVFSSVAAAIIQLAVPQRFIAYFVMSLFMFSGPCLTLSFLFYSKYRLIYNPYSDSSYSPGNHHARSASGSVVGRHGGGHSSSKQPSRPVNGSTNFSTTTTTSSGGGNSVMDRSPSASPQTSPSHLRRHDYSVPPSSGTTAGAVASSSQSPRRTSMLGQRTSINLTATTSSAVEMTDRSKKATNDNDKVEVNDVRDDKPTYDDLYQAVVASTQEKRRLRKKIKKLKAVIKGTTKD